MSKSDKFWSRLFGNKLVLQLILAVFMVGMAIFFLSHEHVEILKIRDQLSNSHPLYLSLGLVLTVCYVLLMGLMYVQCFRSIGVRVSLKSTVKLYLKRNVVSVLLPAGGFSSLVFFTGEVENEGASKSQIHLASTLFGFMCIASVVVIAIPILGFMLWKSTVQATALFGFAALLLITVGFFLLLQSLFKKTWAYRAVTRWRPGWVSAIDEMLNQDVRMVNVWLALFFSVLIEVIGVLHLYLSMLTLGVEPSMEASMIGYITMVLLLMASPFLRGLGAIEVSVTYLLGQYGYPVVLAASMTLLYRFFEFWIPLVAGMLSFISKKDNLILRLLPGFLVFILGLVNILSAVTPSVPERMLFLQDWFPRALPEMSNGMVMMIGYFMLILCVFLLEGSRRAWYAAMTLSVLSVVGHLLKGVDYEEAIVALFAIASLWRTRDYYRLKPHRELSKISTQVFFYSIVALLTFGVAALDIMDRRHFGLDFSLGQSATTIFRMFFLFDDCNLQPLTTFARHFMLGIHMSGGMVMCFLLYSLFKPIFAKPYNTDEEKALAAHLLQKYGRSTTDYFKIYPDKLFFIADDKDGFISFKTTRYYAIALENPVCKDEAAAKDLIQSFDRFCLENGYSSVYYRVPQESLHVYTELGKRSVPIGDEAVVDLETFSLQGQKMKPTRKNIEYLKEQGYESRVYMPPVDAFLLEKLDAVSENWLHSLHDKDRAYTDTALDRRLLQQQIIITVEDPLGRVVAFLNLIPGATTGEAAYDLIRKTDDAPEGVLDLLFVQTMYHLKGSGYQRINLGLVPLSGIRGKSFTERLARYAYENIKSLAHLRGMRDYKERFTSQWNQQYLVYSNNYQLPMIPGALKRISHGK
jgi:phosphatidylglycerol lysyltransferase